MNLSPALPKTPVRTPQTGTSNKALQLTPIWEAVVKNHRIPSDVNENSVFQEISSRLGDLEWPVRQHAFRVLYDLIPIVSKDRLDERIIQNDILNKLTVNLGHPAPGVRKVAMETIRQYLKQTLYSEKMLESFVLNGVKEEDLSETGEVGIIRENVVLGTIVSLVEILKPFIFPENGGYSVSQPFLNKVVEILSEKMKSPIYQEKCAETLWKIRDMVGETRFLRSLDNLSDRTVVDLIRLRQMHDKLVLGEPVSYPKRIYCEPQDSDQSFEMELENSITTYHNYRMIGKDNNSNVSDWLTDGKISAYKNVEESTDYSDGTDTDTYTKETATDRECPVDRSQRENTGAGESESDEKPKEILKVPGERVEAPSSPRVVLETEIQFSEDKAIKMTIVEDEKDSTVNENEIDLFPTEAKSSRESSAERRFVTEDGDLIMKILHNNENEDFQEEERKRTPRRVRFGGEVIKLRTPDSDETDVSVQREEGTEKKKETPTRPTAAHGKPDSHTKPDIKSTSARTEKPKADKLVVHDSKASGQSHIPLPISPATKSPRSREPSPGKRSSTMPTAQKEKSEGSDGEVPESLKSPDSTTEEEPEDDASIWKWSEFGLVGERLISDLKNEVRSLGNTTDENVYLCG
ncbi:UNVERIFIED_CONTAM: hypothetical protein PYX00_009019 [Menopon gallinae]|uniref:TOG domain-containing protein n=1 Tax=Menopon gallinae TaxID=328185 RepID=A0AAW2H9T9_9NEOP